VAAAYEKYQTTKAVNELQELRASGGRVH
jgi:hypothetical protein